MLPEPAGSQRRDPSQKGNLTSAPCRAVYTLISQQKQPATIACYSWVLLVVWGIVTSGRFVREDFTREGHLQQGILVGVKCCIKRHRLCDRVGIQTDAFP